MCYFCSAFLSLVKVQHFNLCNRICTAITSYSLSRVFYSTEIERYSRFIHSCIKSETHAVTVQHVLLLAYVCRILIRCRSDKPSVSMLHVCCSGMEDACGHKTLQKLAQLYAGQMEKYFQC
jgi:hypothetical protein